MAEVKGGDRFRSALDQMAQSLASASTVEVGFLENATYPNGTPVALVAALNEFGGGSQPPRLFFRSMIAKHKAEWPAAVAGVLRATNYNAAMTLAQVGAGIKGQLQQSIVDTNGPPLSPITLMLRKIKAESPDRIITGATVGEAARRVAAGESTAGVSTKPLVDSAHMLNSADYHVA